MKFSFQSNFLYMQQKLYILALGGNGHNKFLVNQSVYGFIGNVSSAAKPHSEEATKCYFVAFVHLEGEEEGKKSCIKTQSC